MTLDFGASWGEGWTLQTDKTTPSPTLLDPSSHRLTLKKEKRRGKIVTLVGSFSLSEEDAQKTLSSLKKSLACGGTYKEGWMEFQGDISPKVKELLLKFGFLFKH